MSEEEKEAIEFLNEQLDKEENDDFCPVCLHNYLVVVLDLIEKQQNEIEEKNIAINKMSKDISRQLEEIEEKSTIIMAGAEKVKELEKGNRSLMESRIKWKDRYYKQLKELKEYNKQGQRLSNIMNSKDSYMYKSVCKNFVPKDKIMAKIEELEKQAKEMKYDYDVSYAEEDLFNKNVKFFKEQMQELLEEPKILEES